MLRKGGNLIRLISFRDFLKPLNCLLPKLNKFSSRKELFDLPSEYHCVLIALNLQDGKFYPRRDCCTTLTSPMFFYSFRFFLIKNYFLCIWVFCLCVFVYHVHAWYMWKPEGFGSPRITKGCKKSCGCWELNWSPLEGQPVLFNT